MSDKYILDENGNPKEEKDLMTWAMWFETADRTVIKSIVGKVTISTIFLGLDHSFGKGKPILWETMIFGGKHDSYQERYFTKEAALRGHNEAVKLVKETPMSNKTAETVNRILVRLWTRAFTVAQQKDKFSDNYWKTAIAQAKKDLRELLKLPEKRKIDRYSPYQNSEARNSGYNIARDEDNAILKTKLEQ